MSSLDMPPQEDASAETKTDALNGEDVKADHQKEVKETAPNAKIDGEGGETDGNAAKENGEGSANKNDSEAAPQACPEVPATETTKPAATNEAKSPKSQSKNEEPQPKTKASSPPSKPANTFVHDPNKITLRFLFAGRDGTHVIIDCKPNDTVGEVKGALMSCWPEDMPECSGGNRLRLICMGKGILSPDSKTLAEADVPVFKTHPTPINVSVRPDDKKDHHKHSGSGSNARNAGAGGLLGDGVDTDGLVGSTGDSSGCCCVIC